ncbi:MAG TPA: DUF5330 domain-containing protein [Aestuariivirga sp.]|jgi:uncharacterized protein DUF5330
MRILRTILVLTGITVLMPSPPDDSNKVVLAGNTADTGYFEVATNTYSDLAAFCERQPGVCETAGFVAHKLELKAKYGARLIYEWANEANPTPSTALQPDIAQGSDPMATATTKLASTKQTSPASQSTLRLEDLIPVWRGPGSAKTS